MLEKEGEVSGVQVEDQGQDCNIADSLLLLDDTVLACLVELEHLGVSPLPRFYLLVDDDPHTHALLH